MSVKIEISKRSLAGKTRAVPVKGNFTSEQYKKAVRTALSKQTVQTSKDGKKLIFTICEDDIKKGENIRIVSKNAIRRKSVK